MTTFDGDIEVSKVREDVPPYQKWMYLFYSPKGHVGTWIGGLFGGNPYQAEPMLGGYGTMGGGPWGVAGPMGYGGYGGLYG